MNEQEQEMRRWLRYALEDLAMAEANLSLPSGIPRNVCFLAQQAVEKALKAALIFNRTDFPYTHNLDTLRNLLPADWRITTEHRKLRPLTIWAVEARYPTDLPDATPDDAQNITRQARVVCDTVLADLVAHGYIP